MRAGSQFFLVRGFFHFFPRKYLETESSKFQIKDLKRKSNSSTQQNAEWKLKRGKKQRKRGEREKESKESLVIW